MRLPRRTLILAAAGLGLAGLLAAAALLTVRQRSDVGVYVGLGVAVAGFVAAVVLDRQRLAALASARQARYGGNAVLASAALLGLLALVNLIVFRNPQSWDLTEDRQYSLAPETVEAIRRLPTDARLIGFYSEERRDSQDAVRPLFQQYLEESGGRVSYEFVDPRREPFRAQEYGVTRDASVVVVLGGDSEVAAFASEQEITSAIVRLANPGARSVYFLTGHGEREIEATDDAGYSQVRLALEAKNYTVQPLSLLVAPQVPAEALAVVIAGPTAPLADAELAALRTFLDAGGGLIVLSDPLPGSDLTPENDRLFAFLAEAWGVEGRDDLVVDLSSSLPLAAIAASYGTHPVTDRLQNLATYFPSARSLAAVPGRAGIGVTELVLTGPNSWGETTLIGLESGARIEFGDGDLPGPLTVAVAAENFEIGARLVVIGDSDFAANADFFGLGNGDLLVNAIDWSAGQEALISLTPKDRTDRFVTPPAQGTIVLLAVVSILLVPAAFLVLGVSTWWTRRSRT